MPSTTGQETEREKVGMGGNQSAGRIPLVGWGIGIGLLLALVVFVHFSTGWKTLLAPWMEVTRRGVALAVVLLLLSYAVRAIRLYTYFFPATNKRFLRTFRVQILHNFFNNLLPMRSGEASFPILMRNNFRIPLSHSLPGLLYLRVLDLHFLLLVGLLSLAIQGHSSGYFLVALFGCLPYLGFTAQRWLRRRLEPASGGRNSKSEAPDIAGGSPKPLGGESGSGETNVIRPVRLLRKSLEGLPRTQKLFWLIWFWTGVNWTVKLFVFAWILTLFSQMPYAYALLGSIAGELSSVLPIHGLAGAGTYEAGIMLGLLPYDLDVQVALAGAVNLHLFVLGTSLLAGTLALLVPVPRLAKLGTGESTQETEPGRQS